MTKIIAPILLSLSLLLQPLSLFAAQSTADNELAIKQIQQFSEAFHQIQRHYIEKLSDEQLMEYAIRGMLNQLDPHSSWLNNTAYSNLLESAEGEYAGIGVEVVQDGEHLLIVTPMDDSPAQEAGIQAGDRIIQINQTLTKGLSFDESVELMRGKKGSTLELTILRQNEQAPLHFNLKRRMIKMLSVRAQLYDQQFAYLRIAQFQKHTARETLKKLQKLEQQAEKPLAGIILDLRNNPGGLLNGAVELSELFLPQGLIVYTQGQTAQSRENFYASGKGPYQQTPLIVLINQGSASASEIVAGALQDQQRALIIGQNSFGKGSVQTILPLPDGQAVKITTALYYTPLGRSIQASGIVPDIELKPSQVLDAKDFTITEKQLAHHLPNTQQDQKKQDNKNHTDSSDYFIDEAIKLLTAMQFSLTDKQ